MKQLTRYEAARQALVEASSVDEAKDILDKAVAMEVYAYQAKDAELVAMSVEIRKRATKRIGQLMEDERKSGRLKHGGDRKSSVAKKRLKLADQGVDNNLADRARKAAAMPEEQFEAEVAKAKALAVAAATDNKAVIAEARADRHAKRTAERAEREQKLAEKLTALPDKKYAVILADPEWRWEAWSQKGLDATSADNHYPTSPTDDIMARNVGSIAAPECVLFLWATVPMLPHALEVMAAWGFTYKSNFCWHKDRSGTGYWNRNKHELLLIGTRGSIPAPAEGSQFESVFEAPVGRHSEKPEIAYHIIETYYPNVPKIELNLRGPARLGWDGWGNEVVTEAAE